MSTRNRAKSGAKKATAQAPKKNADRKARLVVKAEQTKAGGNDGNRGATD